MTITSPVDIPVDGEKGNTFFDKLETWGARINAHVHDSATGERLDLKEVNRASLNFKKDINVTSFPHTVDISTETAASIWAQSPNDEQLDARTAIIQVRSRETEDIGDTSKQNFEIFDGILVSTPDKDTIKLWSGIDMAALYPGGLLLRVVIMGI